MHIHPRDKSPSLNFRFIIGYPPYFVHCGAFTKDGTYVEARIQQKFTQKNDQWDIFDNPSQYLVQVQADDGSMWGDWGRVE